MFIIDSEKNITMTKGDTASLEITLTSDGSPYAMQAGDKLYLTVRNSAKTVIFEKELTGESAFEIVTSDTSELETGAYLYSVTMIFEGGERYTPIPNQNFIIAEEGKEFE
jgi:hypothetical protein